MNALKKPFSVVQWFFSDPIYKFVTFGMIVFAGALLLLSSKYNPPLKIGVLDVTQIIKAQQDRYVALTTGPNKDSQASQEQAKEIVNVTGQRLNQLSTWLPAQCECLVIDKVGVIAMPPESSNRVIDLTPLAVSFINNGK